jgi:hypothetical protein
VSRFGTMLAERAAMLRLAYASLLLAACGSDPGADTPDAPPEDVDAPPSDIDAPSEPDAPPAFTACTSQRGQTNDPDCTAAPSFAVFGASFRPGDTTPAHSIPAAYFPTPLAPWQYQRPTVELDTCMPVASGVGPAPTGPISYRDVGALAVTVNGTDVGGLAYSDTMYRPTGDLATRLTSLFWGGESLRITNANWNIEVIAPVVPEVTSFAHTLETQIEPALEDLDVTWLAGGADDVIEISVGTLNAYTYCAVRDDGTFSIPWQVFQDIFDAGGGELFVFVDRTRRTVAPDTVAGPVQIIVRASDSQGFAFQR